MNMHTDWKATTLALSGPHKQSLQRRGPLKNSQHNSPAGVSPRQAGEAAAILKMIPD